MIQEILYTIRVYLYLYYPCLFLQATVFPARYFLLPHNHTVLYGGKLFDWQEDWEHLSPWNPLPVFHPQKHERDHYNAFYHPWTNRLLYVCIVGTLHVLYLCHEADQVHIPKKGVQTFWQKRQLFLLLLFGAHHLTVSPIVHSLYFDTNERLIVFLLSYNKIH